MHIEHQLKLGFEDVLIRPKRSCLRSRKEVDIQRSFTFCHSKQSWSGVPIIAANMDHVGTFAMAEQLSSHQLLTALSKFVTQEEWLNFSSAHAEKLQYSFVSAGTSENDFEYLKKVMQSIQIPFICLDIANGYSEHFSDFVKKVRDQFPDKTIMAGNVVTSEMTEQLILSGADIVKVGIGPGSVCTTRKQTGVGYPQLSAIIECADAAHGLKGLVCADGGCTVPGDVAKAFGGGADFVMLGGMFSGHDECLGEPFTKDAQQYMRFYGMSSQEAMHKYHGEVAEYRSSEGKSVDIPYRGPVKPMVLDLLGGLRSACTYVGAERLKELSKRTTFVRVNRQLNQVFSAHES